MEARRETAICEAAISLLRTQRHDYLNYLQVIQAYLQMGKTEKALSYMERITGEIHTLDFRTYVCAEDASWCACKHKAGD